MQALLPYPSFLFIDLNLFPSTSSWAGLYCFLYVFIVRFMCNFSMPVCDFMSPQT